MNVDFQAEWIGICLKSHGCMNIENKTEKLRLNSSRRIFSSFHHRWTDGRTKNEWMKSRMEIENKARESNNQCTVKPELHHNENSCIIAPHSPTFDFSVSQTRTHTHTKQPAQCINSASKLSFVSEWKICRALYSLVSCSVSACFRSVRRKR